MKKMREAMRRLFGATTASAHVDPTERLIDQLQMDIAYLRSVNAALLTRLGSHVEPPNPQAEIDFESLQAINRAPRTSSQMKGRATEILAERRREKHDG